MEKFRRTDITFSKLKKKVKPFLANVPILKTFRNKMGTLARNGLKWIIIFITKIISTEIRWKGESRNGGNKKT